MVLENICGPVILYLGFSLIQIIIDIFKNLYNTAFLKFLVMIVFSVILNILCKLGLTIISWFLVFIPFIFMTVVTTLLLFSFGLKPGSGKVDSEDKVNDPTGAGDSYRSGIIAGYVNKWDWKVAGQMAATIASFAVEEYGTQEHNPPLDDVRERYIKNFDNNFPL